LTVVKNKVKHPKVCFTIECHLCHIDDQSILAAIVPSHLARYCGGTGNLNLNLNFKLGHYNADKYFEHFINFGNKKCSPGPHSTNIF
jgi:hypothetical protein